MNSSKLITSSGIVLRHKSVYNQKIVILDENLGKIECYSKKYLPNGIILSYNLKKYRSGYILEEANFLMSPDYWILNDILFFQHILELCLFFFPLDMPIGSHVYNFIKGLYLRPEYLVDSLDKKLFIYCLFQRIGLIQEISDINLSEPELNKYLLDCINAHSFNQQLFTQAQFYKN